MLGGIFAPDINEETGRITFSAFRRAGFDIYISDDLDGMLGRRYEDAESPPLAHALGTTPYDSPRGVDEMVAASKREREMAAMAAMRLACARWRSCPSGSSCQR